MHLSLSISALGMRLSITSDFVVDFERSRASGIPGTWP
jgi:hypothetical protein